MVVVVSFPISSLSSSPSPLHISSVILSSINNKSPIGLIGYISLQRSIIHKETLLVDAVAPQVPASRACPTTSVAYVSVLLPARVFHLKLTAIRCWIIKEKKIKEEKPYATCLRI